jgi:hypothetical protein
VIIFAGRETKLIVAPRCGQEPAPVFNKPFGRL